jgi:hypothetical protein
MSLMSKAKKLLGMGTKEKRTKKEVYDESDNKTQVLLSILKSYARDKKPKRKTKRNQRPRNPIDTGTLGRYAKSGR